MVAEAGAAEKVGSTDAHSGIFPTFPREDHARAGREEGIRSQALL